MVYFNVSRKGYTKVYAHGACINNGKPYAQAGIGVWFAENNPYNVSRPISGRATNTSAEIEAVTEAAKQALNTGIDKLLILTNSDFVIKSITRWMSKWKNNGWRTCKGHEVVNKEELIEMDDVLNDLYDYKIIHVKSYQGNYDKEMADELAWQGAEDYEVDDDDYYDYDEDEYYDDDYDEDEYYDDDYDEDEYGDDYDYDSDYD